MRLIGQLEGCQKRDTLLCTNADDLCHERCNLLIIDWFVIEHVILLLSLSPQVPAFYLQWLGHLADTLHDAYPGVKLTFPHAVWTPVDFQVARRKVAGKDRVLPLLPQALPAHGRALSP